VIEDIFNVKVEFAEIKKMTTNVKTFYYLPMTLKSKRISSKWELLSQ